MRTKLAPVWPCVRFWKPGRGNDASKALDQPCWRRVGSSCQGNCREKPSDAKHPSFPAEKHRASLGEKPDKPNRRCPAPPPLGGGVSSFWGEKPNSARFAPVWRFEPRVGKRHQRSPRPALCGLVCSFGGRVGERHHRSCRPALLARREAPVEVCTAQVKAIGRTDLKEERLKMKSQTAKNIYTKS